MVVLRNGGTMDSNCPRGGERELLAVQSAEMIEFAAH